jgi:hypothetical protein
MKRLAAIAVAMCSAVAHAHSASDAYLTLDVGAGGIEAHWDIALRDLHFVLALDDDGDGAITWGEVKRRHADIESYAYRRLRADGDGRPCLIEPAGQRVATRADGAYAALTFRIACKGIPRKVTLDYRLLFDVDPTHRGIVVVRNGKSIATSLMSPSSARMELPVER